MQKKYWISFGFLTVLLLAILLSLNAFTPKKEQIQQPKPTCCKKVSKECTEAPGQTTLENLSHQFITVPALFY